MLSILLRRVIKRKVNLTNPANVINIRYTDGWFPTFLFSPGNLMTAFYWWRLLSVAQVYRKDQRKMWFFFLGLFSAWFSLYIESHETRAGGIKSYESFRFERGSDGHLFYSWLGRQWLLKYFVYQWDFYSHWWRVRLNYNWHFKINLTKNHRKWRFPAKNTIWYGIFRFWLFAARIYFNRIVEISLSRIFS